MNRGLCNQHSAPPQRYSIWLNHWQATNCSQYAENSRWIIVPTLLFLSRIFPMPEAGHCGRLHVIPILIERCPGNALGRIGNAVRSPRCCGNRSNHTQGGTIRQRLRRCDGRRSFPHHKPLLHCGAGRPERKRMTPKPEDLPSDPHQRPTRANPCANRGDEEMTFAATPLLPHDSEALQPPHRRFPIHTF